MPVRTDGLVKGIGVIVGLLSCIGLAQGQPCVGGGWGQPVGGSLPLMQFPLASPMRTPRPVAVNQQIRSDMYLPAMPDMLRTPPQTAMPARYSQKGTDAGKATSIVRGQAPEEIPVKTARPIQKQENGRLSIPTPEDLGLSCNEAPTPGQAKADGTSDWAAARLRLDQLGAAFYRLEKAQDGTFHFICALPSSKTQTQQHQIEATGATEEEAIRQALAQLERWMQTKWLWRCFWESEAHETVK